MNLGMKVLLALVVFTGYLLQLYTLTESLRPSLIRFAESRATDTRRLTLVTDYALRCGIVLVSFLLAVLIPNLEDLIPLVGVTAGMLLALIIPATVDVTTFLPVYLEEKRYKDIVTLLIDNTFFFSLGIMIRRSQSPLRKSSSHAVQSNGDLDSLRKLYNSLSASLLSKGDNTDEVVKQLQIFPGYLTDVVSNNKFSSTDLIFISQTFEKVADFLGTDKASNVQGRLKATLSPQWNRLNQFFTKLTDEAVKQFGADIWLALSKLLLSSSEFKLLSNEWDEVFLPMEHWFSAMDGEAAEICLRKWNAFVSFVGSKLDGRSKRSKLIPMFCKPLRSRTLINKLNSPEPIIEGYTTLIKSFKDLLDEHFDELVICFLRFLSGRSAAIFNSTEEIEKELNKPIDSKSSKLVLNCAYPSHLEYIADDRLYQASDRASTHLLPVICAILGVDCNGSSTDIPACGENPLQTQKYAIFFGQMVRLAGNLPDAKGKSSIISSCFAALAQRIGCIEEIAVKRSESRLLFVQIRTWISENNFNLEELESALSVLFTPTDHSIHANTVGEWPAKNILSAVLDKCADGKISSLLEIVCGTLRDAPENPDTILGRVDELSTLISEHVERFEVRTLLKTWAQLADIMKNHIRETDDINQGNLTCPDFSTTFGLLRLIFKIANCADEDFDTAMVQKCCSLFGQLYAEAQNTVRREYRCSAGTILSGVLGQLISPKTSCCVNFYVSAFTSILDVYPFSLLNESEVFSGPSLEFNPLGEIAPFVDALKVIQKALTELTTSAEGKLPRTAPENCLSIVVICQKLLDSLEKPNMIRNMFLTLSDLLKDMYDMFFGDDIRFKDVSRGALDAYLVILDLVKKKISGPYDDILLSGCAPLMAQLLGGIGGRRSKLRVAAAELWNVTFAKAKSLTYPKELRKILTTLVQKRVVYAPGLSRKSLSSTDLNEYKEITVVESPSKSAEDSSSGRQHGRRSRISRQPSDAEISTSSVPVSTSRSARRQAKRSFSPVDSQADNTVASKRKAVSEDEIPPSPVVKVEEEPEKQNQKSQNPKFKKNQLTPVRYATAGTKRRNYVSLLDEDSVDYVPIPSTDSAKKMKLTDRQKEIFSEKRERMPFLDEDSQSIAVITNLQTEFDLESSQSASLNNNVPVPVAVKEEPVIENGDADEPMETVALASEDAKGFFVDTAADSNNSDDAAVKRRSKIKLNFDKVETTAASSRNSGSSLDVDVNRVVSDSVKKVDGPASHIQIIEPNLESEDSVESSGEASAELSGDSDVEQIKQMEKPPRSRRTQKKGTPTKYVAKKRRSIVKNTEKEKTRRQSRTSTVNVEVVEVAKIAADVEGSKEVIKDKNAVESEEMQPLPEIEDVLTNQGSRDLDGKSRESGNAMTSEKNSEDAEKVATAMTPSLVQRLGGTPGILKKVNSPSTAEKKLRRVHFDNNFENNAADSASTIIEEADKVSTIDEQFPASPKGTLKVITPRRPFAHVQPAEEKTATTTSLEKDDPSPVKIEGDSEDLPIFADLMECQESIAKIVGKLVPVSTNTGSITLRKTLEARGIVQIRHLASMSRREIAALNIKRPRVETTLKALTQFARDYVPPANKPLFKAASVPETETAAVPSEEPPAVLPEGIVEEENAVIENAHPDGEDKLEEIVATGDVAEAATVSPTKEAAEPAEMLNSEECSVEQPQPDPSLVYAEKLRQWKETVLEANRQFELAMQAAEESGLSPGEIRSKRGLLMMVNGCVEMIAAPYSSR
ncbi:hypothetical protein Y032_0543g3221 [Ancylostoma ceylanicum]|nr:hypothetical protein Y032_0543g3221 [Ancylostoma ceylanicum]